MMLVGLFYTDTISPPKSTKPQKRGGGENKEITYKRQPAVIARRNLGLVRVDEDLGVPGRPAAAVAGHDPVVRPPHGLLVDELDGRVRPGLEKTRRQLRSQIRHGHSPEFHRPFFPQQTPRDLH
jgi:hypothetical protein